MLIEKNTAIPMSDGAVLSANVYRPHGDGQYPVVMAFGVYGKDVHFEDGFNPQWQKLKAVYPEIDQDGSSGRYLRWEVADPERWVPDGFIMVVVDGRGSGMSPGYLDVYSPRETRDYYECIEWAGTQKWSSGKVGLLGVSYLAIKQWQVAALKPPHLAAIVPWEGCCDYYRDSQRHGGILSNTFNTAWWPRQILETQNGNSATAHRDRETGLATTGTSRSPAQLRGSRAECPDEMNQHSVIDAWFEDRTPNLNQIEIPLLSAANWGGMGMHLRGNFEGYLGAKSREKWLFAHIGTHYESFYLPRYVAIQKRFFEYYLKGHANGWDAEPRVQLAIRQPDGTATLRAEHEWPLARTKWTPYFLDASTMGLSSQLPSTAASASYESTSAGLDFTTTTFTEDVEFTGPVALKLWISSSTQDLDVFVVLRLLDQEGQDVFIIGAHEQVPVAAGWLRASHRKLDAALSKPYRPWHSHDAVQKLSVGEVYELDIEILPTSMVYRKGYSLRLTVLGKDFVVAPPGRILHNDAQDRPAEEFNCVGTLYTGGAHPSCLLMPVVPAKIQ
jgi:predicted acyl esterase